MSHTLRSTMHELTRTVRFCINPEPWKVSAGQPRYNTFAAWPSMRGLGHFYELEVHCAGKPGDLTGYIVNASDVDAVVRDHALPLIAHIIATDATSEPATVLPEILRSLTSHAPFSIRGITWKLTPYHAISMDASMTDHIQIAADFDFAASHRLDCQSLSASENQQIFGKCNNPNGHGHNYRVRPVVSMSVADAAEGEGLATLERIVSEQVIERFDHKHLNHDVPEFEDVNPSVEHITRICFELLDQPIREAGGRLVEVTVWETDKTSCTYAAAPAE